MEARTHAGMSQPLAATAPPWSGASSVPCADPSQCGLSRTLGQLRDDEAPGLGARVCRAVAQDRSTSGRKQHRWAALELGLAQAVQSLAAHVEDLGEQLEARCSTAAEHEAGLARALDAFTSGCAGAGAGTGAEATSFLATPLSGTPSPDIEERLLEVLEQIKGTEPWRECRAEGMPSFQHGLLPEQAPGEEVEERMLAMLEQIKLNLEIHKDHQEERRVGEHSHSESTSETQVIKELVGAVQALRSPKTAPPALADSRGRHPQYAVIFGNDGRMYEFPEVEVALKLYQVCNVDTAQLTFEADFVCQLDWQDPNVEGIPSEDLKLLDWRKYFNPHLEIDNAKDEGGWLDGVDQIPRRHTPWRRSCSSLPHEKTPAAGGRAASRPADEERLASGSGTGPWLRKTMRFRGTLVISDVDLRCFPFDVQALPVRLKAACSRSLALGTPASEAASQELGRVHLVQSRKALLDESYRSAAAHLRGQGHHAVPGADETLLEFDISGLTGWHREPSRGDVYCVSVVVTRPSLASYFWDLVIMNLLVALAAAAFWDTAAPELSSRMSISLTVILTLAAYTASRPAPIEKAPYTTLHDWCAHMSMFLVTGISVQNVFATVMCGGQHEEAPPYMAAEFESNREDCSLGWCSSRAIDCRGLVILLATWCALAVYTVAWLLRSRRRAARHVWGPREERHGSADPTPLARGGSTAEEAVGLDATPARVPALPGGAKVAVPSAPVPAPMKARPRASRAAIPAPRSPPRRCEAAAALVAPHSTIAAPEAAPVVEGAARRPQLQPAGVVAATTLSVALPARVVGLHRRSPRDASQMPFGLNCRQLPE
mmetsp:Transcript_93703/g.260865  ORF Transcript_93703/g.260865 Transcript_93703/m.260865 type:complete len:830 (-) Transcript_93703:298-2787(-)